MKINSKFVALAGAALLAGVGAFAQATDDYNLPQGFKFTNEIGSDVLLNAGNMHSNSSHPENNYRSEFGGIYDDITIEYTSEKFWFELSPRFGISDKNENYFSKNFDSNIKGHGVDWRDDDDGALNADDTAFSWWEVNFGVRFTPFDIVDFYLNNDVWTPGSNLYARDTHLANGNLAGDGISIIFKPISGLRLAAAIPFSYGITSSGNFINAEIEDEEADANGNSHLVASNKQTSDFKFRVDFGADYSIGDFLTVGGTIHNAISRAGRGYGLFANVKFGSIEVDAGYQYKGGNLDVFDFSDIVQVGGTNQAMVSAKVGLGSLTATLDGLYNLKPHESYYDLYAALGANYELVPGKFAIRAKAGVAFDMGTFSESSNHGAMALGTINEYFDDLIFRENDKNGHLTDDVVTDEGGYKSYKKAATAILVEPGVNYKTGRNEFDGAVRLINFLDGDGSYAVKLPVKWVWTF